MINSCLIVKFVDLFMSEKTLPVLCAAFHVLTKCRCNSASCCILTLLCVHVPKEILKDLAHCLRISIELMVDVLNDLLLPKSDYTGESNWSSVKENLHRGQSKRGT